MPPKNISTGAYWREDPTDVPHKDVETDFETSEYSRSELSTSHKKGATSDNSEDDFVTVSHDSTPSPTASDVILKFHLEDTIEAQHLASKWRKAGLDEHEVKEKLKMALEKFDRDRKEKEEGKIEKNHEDEHENDSECKGKGVDLYTCHSGG